MILFSTMLLGGTACGGGSTDVPRGSAHCKPVAKVTQVAPDIASLGLERWGTIAKAEARAGYLGAEVISEQEVVEIYPDLVRRLSGPYIFLGGDNEGFEAELSFVDRKERLVSFSLTQIDCDRVRLEVLIEKRVT